MQNIDIKDLSLSGLEEALAGMGEKPYRAKQIFRWLYRDLAGTFEAMTDLPASLRTALGARFRIPELSVVESRRSPHDRTAKYLFRLEDSNTIEAVLIPEGLRNTICLSSQVGCRYGCLFCASSSLGFERSLKLSEILNEVIAIRHADPHARITNIVFMGIGEPLDNYDNVMSAIRVFNYKDAFNIGARRMTISTCGVVPGIERLAKERLQIELSVSLHSADDAVRSKIMPVNRIYPLAALVQACKDYTKTTKRIVTFEYVLIKGVNSSREDAMKVAALLKGLNCKVNAISYNRIGSGAYEPPREAEAAAFMNTLKEKHVNAMHRKPKGYEIDAGCGQLRISRMK